MSQSGSAYRQWVASPWADLAMAAGLTLLGQLELHSAAQGGLDGLGQGIALLAQTAPVAIRRTYTLAAACVGAIALIAEALIVEPTNTLAGLLAGLILIYSVGRHLSGRMLRAATVVMLAGLGLHMAAMPSSGPADFAFAGLFSAVAWGLGQGGRRRVEAAESAERLAVLTRAEHDAHLASAVAEERARIAREMHDIVAHGMGVMVVQATAAEHLLDRDPELARQPLATVRQTGQESLAEMRRLLGLLRTGAGDVSGKARDPRPTLAQVPDLVAQLQAAGMPVTLTMEGIRTGEGGMPPGLDLCAFRIVQESLTNALKHATGAATSVEISATGSAVILTITTAGPAIGEGPGVFPAVMSRSEGATGLGLIGMRERVAVYGGTLVAQPQPDSGFLVRAQLPVPR
jgi:signal transduction histidine kinase